MAQRGAGRFFDRTGLPLLLLGGLIALFLAAPLLALAFNLSGSDLVHTYGEPQTQQAVRVSLFTATVSTAVVGSLGVPLAYLLARFRFPGRSIINVLIVLPLVLPPVSAGILLIMMYGPYGTIGQLFQGQNIQLVDTTAGIILAQIFVSAPYVIVVARSAFSRIEPEYEEAAASMGASLWTSFRHVALPMARSGILAGLTLGWMRSMGEFGATVILAYHPYSLPVLNYVNLNSAGLPAALPLALLAVVIASLVVLLVVLFERADWDEGLGRV